MADLFTETELRILVLVANGNSNENAARGTGAEPHEVKAALARMRRRVGARNRAHLTLIALRWGWVTKDDIDLPEEKVERQMDGTQPLTLAGLRRAAERSQTDVAKHMGVSRGRVSQIEADFPEVSYKVMVRYMEALGGALLLESGGVVVKADVVVADAGREEYREGRQGRSGRIV